MAFLRKRKKFPAIVVLSVLIVLCVLCYVFYYLYNSKLNEIMQKYEDEINQLNLDLYSIKRQAYLPKNDIPCGTVITKDLFEIVEMKLEIHQKNLLDESDMGKVNIIFLTSGIPVLKSSVVDEKHDNDLRENEFNMFLIKTNQKKGDFVDVRIIFPNGENYIVLSKKQIIDLNLEENTVWLWLDEYEIHNISSAIIDAYIHQGTKIYVTTYIVPELQEAAIPFYAPNEDVLNLIQNDPNIVDKAGDSLARIVRATLESNLKAITDENISKVTTGINEEITKNNEIIQSQHKLSQDNENSSDQSTDATNDETETFN